MSNRRVLVVGTTADYIDIINRRLPQRAIFVTDADERAKAKENPPNEDTELLCDLADCEQVVVAVRKHLNRFRITPSGIACFDCESMGLAAFIAGELGLSYPSAEAVAACRSKLVSKQLWRGAGLPCPRVELVQDASEAVSFMHAAGGSVVLKPLTGSGSELVFLCTNEDECTAAVGTLKSRLASHPDRRMYEPYFFDGKKVDPRKVFVIEEFIRGDEYSCDFVFDGDRVDIIRIARKIPDPGQVFGTTRAYIMPAELPSGLGGDSLFCGQLGRAAGALGLSRAICMLDFVVRDGRAVMIELAPRLGGDCLPALLLRSCGVDIIGYALDFAERRGVRFPAPSRWTPLVGMRLFGRQCGEITRIDSESLREDRRVVECCLKRRVGHRVVLPPEDYESRLLGHVIFEHSGPGSIESECVEIGEKLKVEMRTQACATASRF
ncbi:MAG: ATP-grasp domain-containing protein [Planctomycetes bacterium]|nr:ATP-grasp domain-containing protein [Planctomycetota bacterium]